MNGTQRAAALGSRARNVEVLIVDDQLPFRIASSAVVEATDGFHLWGTATSAAEAVASVSESDDDVPTLVLMDVNLGDVSGIEATRQMMHRWPELHIVLVSTMAENDLPLDAASCGAQGYLSKSMLSPEALADLVLERD